MFFIENAEQLAEQAILEIKTCEWRNGYDERTSDWHTLIKHKNGDKVKDVTVEVVKETEGLPRNEYHYSVYVNYQDLEGEISSVPFEDKYVGKNCQKSELVKLLRNAQAYLMKEYRQIYKDNICDYNIQNTKEENVEERDEEER